jgi:hypothetical protein
MKKRVQKLHEALTSGALVRWHHASLPEVSCWGYVVGMGATFALLHSVGVDATILNGYMAVPLTEMRKVRLCDEEDFLHRALRLKGIQPKPQPDILLLDFPGLLSSVKVLFPLVTLRREYKDGDLCYIGHVVNLTEKSVALRCIGRQAEWQDRYPFRYKDITRIEFGGGYEEALWMVSEYDRRWAAAQQQENDQ